MGEYKITQLCNSSSQGLCSQCSHVGYYGTIVNPCCQEGWNKKWGSESEQMAREKGKSGGVNIYLSKINTSFIYTHPCHRPHFPPPSLLCWFSLWTGNEDPLWPSCCFLNAFSEEKQTQKNELVELNGFMLLHYAWLVSLTVHLGTNYSHLMFVHMYKSNLVKQIGSSFDTN